MVKAGFQPGVKQDLDPPPPRRFGTPGPKARNLFEPEKTFVKLRTAYSVKPVFSYVVKGIRIKITAKFRPLRRLRFEDTRNGPQIR